jgi:hypothetical protein
MRIRGRRSHSVAKLLAGQRRAAKGNEGVLNSDPDPGSSVDSMLAPLLSMRLGFRARGLWGEGEGTAIVTSIAKNYKGEGEAALKCRPCKMSSSGSEARSLEATTWRELPRRGEFWGSSKNARPGCVP